MKRLFTSALAASILMAGFFVPPASAQSSLYYNTPRTYQVGQCYDFKQDIWYKSRRKTIFGEACLRKYGQWEIVSRTFNSPHIRAAGPLVILGNSDHSLKRPGVRRKSPNGPRIVDHDYEREHFTLRNPGTRRDYLLQNKPQKRDEHDEHHHRHSRKRHDHDRHDHDKDRGRDRNRGEHRRDRDDGERRIDHQDRRYHSSR